MGRCLSHLGPPTPLPWRPRPLALAATIHAPASLWVGWECMAQRLPRFVPITDNIARISSVPFSGRLHATHLRGCFGLFCAHAAHARGSANTDFPSGWQGGDSAFLLTFLDAVAVAFDAP